MVSDRCHGNFNCVIFKQIVMNGIANIALSWLLSSLIDGKSTMVQVMAWYRLAASHYVNQCWAIFMSAYGVIRPQWISNHRREYHVGVAKFQYLVSWLTYLPTALLASLTGNMLTESWSRNRKKISQFEMPHIYVPDSMWSKIMITCIANVVVVIMIKWKHFPRYWPFVREIQRSPVNSPHKGQWRGSLMFSLMCVWINSWVNNRRPAIWDVIALIMTSS